MISTSSGFPHRDTDEHDSEQASFKALQVIKLGSPIEPLGLHSSPLRITRLPANAPINAKKVRLRVTAAALNFADMLQIQGQYQERPQLPFIPGNECSGTVVSVGCDVRGLKPGDRVCAVSQGGAFAEQVDVLAAGVIKIPSSVDLESAAGLPVAFGTAYLALKTRANIQPGQIVLILGAAGGVGLAAVQLAKVMGARVIAAARGKAKVEVLKQLEADAVIDLTNKKPEQLKSLVKDAIASINSSSQSSSSNIRGGNHQGVDIVFDPVGGPWFMESLKVVNWGAQLLIIGFASGSIPKIPLNIALVKNLTVHGIYWGSYMQNNPVEFRRSLEECAKLFAQGDVSVHVSHRYHLEQAQEAFSVLAKREVIGKLLFVPSPRSML